MSFLSLDCVIRAGQVSELTVGSGCTRPPVMSHHYFIRLRLHATSAYFVRAVVQRACTRIVNARNNSHERQPTDMVDMNYERGWISPVR